jgi:peptidoglycan/xylan/chitin deacetylase (PgdA/CDA1 family)
MDQKDLNHSILIKSLVSSFLNSFGLISLKIKYVSPNNFVFLMYHRVLPKGRVDGIQAGMYVEPGTFEAHIRFLKNHFKIISLSDLSLFSKESYTSNSRPLCLLTFDDGFYDFYEYAFPVLETYQVPATVFLPTDFIGTNKWFWTDRLARILYKGQKDRGRGHEVKVTPPNHSLLKRGVRWVEKGRREGSIIQLEGLKVSRESQLEKAINILKQNREEETEQILAELSKRSNINEDHKGRAFLSWEEVRVMAQSGLVSFGSHTSSHRILTTLTDEEVWDELIRPKEKLIAEKVVNPSFVPFCYPNGNYNEKIAGMVKEAGYSMAVTTENGWNRFGSDPFTLKRIGIHQDISSTEAMFGCRVTGLF